MSDLFPAQGELFEGRYRVGPLIGSGGFARVYKARQEDLGRDVALKVLTPSGLDDGEQYDENLANRFIHEARLVSRLRDPHTITMYDYGKTDQGLLYMVFEYISGVSLSALIKREGPIAPERVVKILKQTLSSLEEAHAHDYLHRDIKPGNIMVFEHVGRADQVKLLDFGIAKVTDSKSTLKGDLTADGALIGTPRYMSPEQIRGHEMNAQSDIYSLGLVAFELVMGRKAIESNSSVTIIGQQLDPEPFEIPEMPGCPAGLRHIINRMLAKDRDARYQSVREVIDALESWRSPEGVFDIDLDRQEASFDPDLQETHRIEDPSAELDDLHTRQLPQQTGKQEAVNRQEAPPRQPVPASVGQRSSQQSSQQMPAFSSNPEPARPVPVKSSAREQRTADGAKPLAGESFDGKPVVTNSSRFEKDVYRGPRPSAKSETGSTTKYMVGGIVALVLIIGTMLVLGVIKDGDGEKQADLTERAPVTQKAQAASNSAPEESSGAENKKKVAVSRRMSIRTTPTSRNVWLNGRPMGKTPVTVDEASVRFPATVRVQVAEGRDHVVDVPEFERDVHVDVSDELAAKEQPTDAAQAEPETEDVQEKVVRQPEPEPVRKTPKKVVAEPRSKPSAENTPEPEAEKDDKLTLPALDY